MVAMRSPLFHKAVIMVLLLALLPAHLSVHLLPALLLGHMNRLLVFAHNVGGPTFLTPLHVIDATSPLQL